jgi:hypothetical protein
MYDSPVLPFIALCAMIFGIAYLRFTTQHRQRMAMIEKGLTPADLEKWRRGTPADLERGRRGSTAYALGLLLLGAGAGLGLGWFTDSAINGDNWGNNPLPYFISVFLCGGVALITYHRTIERPKR